jgi:hypothetical protein
MRSSIWIARARSRRLSGGRARDRVGSPSDNPATTRVLILAAFWFVGTFALTIFCAQPLEPVCAAAVNRASARDRVLAAAALGGSQPAMHRRLIRGGGDGAGVPPSRVLVSQSALDRDCRALDRDVRRDSACGARASRCRPADLRDDRSSRRSLANAYDQLLPEAVRLAAGRDIRADIDTGQTTRSGAPRIVSRMAGSEWISRFSDNMFRHSSGGTRLSPDTIRTGTVQPEVLVA